MPTVTGILSAAIAEAVRTSTVAALAAIVDLMVMLLSL